MIEEEKQDNQEEEENLTCPECGKEFQDMRGLTSHARHIHQINKEEVAYLNEVESNDNSLGWNFIGSIAAGIIALITIGKLK